MEIHALFPEILGFESVTLFMKHPVHTCTLGLFKKHQLWKLKIDRVVSHGFRHAELDGAQKNRLQVLLGVANLISNF